MHMLRSASRRLKRVPAPLAGAILLTLTLAACDTGKSAAAAKTVGGKGKANSGCAEEPGQGAVSIALRDFIKTTEPKPMRFLSAVGTDSAVPDASIRELQDKGPTYLWGGNDAAKKKLREKIELAGPFTALLIAVRGDKKNGDGTEVVSIGGHFLTGEFDGKPAARHAYTMACDTAGWHVKSKADQ